MYRKVLKLCRRNNLRLIHKPNISKIKPDTSKIKPLPRVKTNDECNDDSSSSFYWWSFMFYGYLLADMF